MRRDTFLSAAAKVVQSIKESNLDIHIRHLLQSPPSREGGDKRLREEVLRIYGSFSVYLASFSEVELEVMEALNLGALRNTAFWNDFTSDDARRSAVSINVPIRFTTEILPRLFDITTRF